MQIIFAYIYIYSMYSIIFIYHVFLFFYFENQNFVLTTYISDHVITLTNWSKSLFIFYYLCKLYLWEIVKLQRMAVAMQSLNNEHQHFPEKFIRK